MMAISIQTLVILGVFGINLAQEQVSEICSVQEPTSSQVCVSIKFPWKDDPVFFCTGKSIIVNKVALTIYHSCGRFLSMYI